jgi:hypothetical protein
MMLVCLLVAAQQCLVLAASKTQSAGAAAAADPGALPAPATPPPLAAAGISAAPDPFLQAAFEPWTWHGKYARHDWTGGDVGASCKLTDSRTLWVFGDTLIGHWGKAHGRRISDATGAMPHSSIGVMNLTMPPSHGFPGPVAWHWGQNDSSFFRPSWEKNKGPGRQAFWAAVTTPRTVNGRLLVLGNRVLYTAKGGPMGFLSNETVVFSVDGATKDPDNPANWTMDWFTLPHTGNLSHLPNKPLVDLARGTLLLDGKDDGRGGHPAGGEDPWLYLYGYVRTAAAVGQLPRDREIVSRIRWQALQGRSFSAQQYWVGGSTGWQQGWSDDLPQRMAALWSPGVAEMQPQWSTALQQFVVLTIPFGATFVEMRSAPAPEGPWSQVPKTVYHIPPPQNDTTKFFCYATMQHDLVSLPRNESASESESDIVFTYVCNGRTLGDVYASGAEASYIPQFVRMRFNGGFKSDDEDGSEAQAAALALLTRHWLENHATPRQAKLHLDMVRSMLTTVPHLSPPKHGGANALDAALAGETTTSSSRRLEEEGVACTADDLASRSAAVNAECCDEPTEDCSSGEPANCNAGCAGVLVPFFEDCHDALLGSQGGPALVKTLSNTIQECTQALAATCEQCPCTSGSAAATDTSGSAGGTPQTAVGKLPTLPAGFAESYTLDGCADPVSHCGEYRRVAAACVDSDHCPGDPSMCDGAPVYQRAGEVGGPVLYRFHYSDGGTRWWVGVSSTALSTCDNGPHNEGYFMYADSNAAEGAVADPVTTKQWYETGATGWHRQDITVSAGH